MAQRLQKPRDRDRRKPSTRIVRGSGGAQHRVHGHDSRVTIADAEAQKRGYPYAAALREAEIMRHATELGLL